MKKQRIVRKSRVFWIVALMILGMAVFLALADRPLATRTENVNFRNGDSVLAGTLTFPTTPGPYPAVVFIHGDGPMTRDSGGYFTFLQEEFTRHGFACLSWDKPGVGESTGDWLGQSMSARALEALAAIEFLQSREDIRPDSIGFWGGSQAGWVMPIAASMSSDVAFIISVSGAISWEKQGLFMTTQRLWREGYSKQAIQEALACEEKANSFLRQSASFADYEELVATLPEGCSIYSGDAFPAEKWRFARLNIDSDARAALRQTRCPVLAVFGEQDAHVDASESMAVYKEELAAAGNGDVTIRLFPNANHILVKSKKAAPIGFWTGVKLAFWGKDAFAPEFLDTMTEWLEERIQ